MSSYTPLTASQETTSGLLAHEARELCLGNTKTLVINHVAWLAISGDSLDREKTTRGLTIATSEVGVDEGRHKTQ